MVPSNIYASLVKPEPVPDPDSGMSTPTNSGNKGKGSGKGKAKGPGKGMANTRLPLSHTAMIPWTAEFVANLVRSSSASVEGDGIQEWTAERVMEVANRGAGVVYGIA